MARIKLYLYTKYKCVKWCISTRKHKMLKDQANRMNLGINQYITDTNMKHMIIDYKQRQLTLKKEKVMEKLEVQVTDQFKLLQIRSGALPEMKRNRELEGLEEMFGGPRRERFKRASTILEK